jgi:dihydrofolate synthase / folylpolyglutamate synthase
VQGLGSAREGDHVPLTYRDALDWLIATGQRGIKPGLERVEALLEALGNPQAGLRGVLVAGTNGKGSVCALVDAACRAAGQHTVTLVKPHLRSYRERFLLDRAHVSPAEFAALVERVQPAAAAVSPSAGAPSQFEILTVMGILFAADHRPDVVVCEVGLGGRLDSTNVLDLGIAVITNIALDHCDRLGDTVDQIAAEKAGIIKAGNDVVTGADGVALEVIRAHAASAGARRVMAVGDQITVAAARSLGHDGIEAEIVVAGGPMNLRVALPGLFQASNAAVAAAACLTLRERGVPLGDEAIAAGFAGVSWPGRMQWLPGEPPIILDGAHNPAAVAAMVPAVAELRGDRPLAVVFGAMADKDIDGMLEGLRGLGGTMVFTQVDTPRAASAVSLARSWGHDGRAISWLPDALTAARLLAGREGLVLVCGSIYLVGDALRLLSAETVD